MPIDFSPDRWDKIKETYGKFWNNTLDRPIIKAILREEKGAAPDIPLLSQQTCNRLDISAEDIIDRIDYHLSQNIYLADSFPMVNFNSFGPGIVSAFCGANLDNSTGRVWFSPKEELPLSDIHVEYDKNNIWLNRIKDIYAAAGKKWKGQVLCGMPDLGGVMDIAAVFRGSQNLLMDLYDEPEEVIRLANEITDVWTDYFNDLTDVLNEYHNPGSSHWLEIYCKDPSYILQCDFCYMISAGMFDEFVAPHLKTHAERIKNVIYHLDGIGEIKHVPSLLKIDDIHMIQWIPGDAQPQDAETWMELYRMINDSGRWIYMYGTSHDLMNAVNTLHSTRFVFGDSFEYSFGSIENFQNICETFQIESHL